MSRRCRYTRLSVTFMPGVDGLEHPRGLGVLPEAAQRHVEPVARSHDALVVAARQLEALPVRLLGRREVALQVVGEAEVVVDRELQGRRGGALRVGARLGLVLLALHERGGARQIGNGLVELPHRDVAVAAVAQQPRVVRVLREAAGEGLDRLAVAAEVGVAAAEPDRGVGAVGVLQELGRRRGEVGVEGLLPRRASARGRRAARPRARWPRASPRRPRSPREPPSRRPGAGSGRTRRGSARACPSGSSAGGSCATGRGRRRARSRPCRPGAAPGTAAPS